VTLVPALFFLLLELGLRLFGYGYPTAFFVKMQGRDAYKTNQRFGWRFFPPAMARAPAFCVLPAEKAEDTYRVFVLGGSAAMGTPDSAFGFGRMLEAMLRDCYPGAKFEVVNAAMTAINSHVVLPIARDCARRQPDLFVVYMGNNEVVGPYGSGTVFQSFSGNLGVIRASIFAKSTKIGQLASSLLGRRETGSRWEGMEMFLANHVAADDPRMEGVYSHFRANLADICEVGNGAGAKVIVCTVATDLKDCAPFAAEHRAGLSQAELAKWDGLCKEGVALAESGDDTQAVKTFHQAEEIDDRHAELHFRLGRCLLALGQYDEARRHFILARDLDALRFRADSRINEIIREVAGDKGDGGVCLVDAERAFEESDRTEHRLPGRELFYEHVHMNPEGNYLLAKVVFEKVVELLPDSIRRGGKEPSSAPGPQRCFELIALTAWDRYRMKLAISQLQDKAPFTDQLDNKQQSARREEELRELQRKATTRAALADARHEYAAAVEREPENVELRLDFARLLQQSGDYQAAVEQWHRLLGLFPEEASWQIEYGTVLKDEGKSADAVAEFRQAMELDSAVAATANFNIGTVLLEQGKPAEAAKLFREVLAMDPQMAQARNSLGVALARQGMPEEAIEEFRQAIESDAKLAGAHNNLACVLAERGDLGAAAEQYRQALEIDPRHLAACYSLSSILAKQGKVPEAIEEFRRGVRAIPDSAEAHYRFGCFLAGYHRTFEAVEEFREVLRLDPDHIRARHNLAVGLAQLGNTAQAIEQFRQVLGKQPDHVPARKALARILATHSEAKFRDGPEAVRLLEPVCAGAGQQDPELLDVLAAAYAEAGRFSGAVEAAERAVRLAEAKGEKELAAGIRERLSRYKEGRPLRAAAAGSR
jgi:tetratricopeptide (TPR) repeat protein